MLWPDFLVERINLCVFPLSGRLEQGAGVGKGGGGPHRLPASVPHFHVTERRGPAVMDGPTRTFEHPS